MMSHFLAFMVTLICIISPTHCFLIGHLEEPAVPSLGRGDEGKFRYAAVTTSTDLCARVGVDILAKHGGSGVDAAIAASLCVGVTRFHSSGIGGGNFMTVYDSTSGKVVSILSRCMASAAATTDMFVNNTIHSRQGGKSIAIPGEVMAFWEAHKLYGRLPWKMLFQPSIEMAESGFPFLPQAEAAIQSQVETGVYDRFPVLKARVTNPTTGTWYKEGEMIKLPALARTLRTIADGGAAEFYNGTFADTMVKEIQDAGGIMTKQDFQNYYSEITQPLSFSLGRGMTIYTTPLPSGGPILVYILNILSGYNMTSADIATNDKTVATYHRFLEAFKHAYAARSKLGSPDGEDAAFGQLMKQLLANITSHAQGEAIRQRISDYQTFPWQSYYPSYYNVDDDGTSQISVLAPNGDAVSITSTVNLYFGSKVVGSTTGIVYNNNMDDFSTRGLYNAFGVAPSIANFIKPRKRPLSSMCPSITLDDRTGRPILVHGSAGGTRITTLNAFLTAMTLWIGEDIKTAIDAPRPHHQLFPDNAFITRSRPQWLLDGLRRKGHNITSDPSSSGTPNGILERVPCYILANAQDAIVDGY